MTLVSHLCPGSSLVRENSGTFVRVTVNLTCVREALLSGKTFALLSMQLLSLTCVREALLYGKTLALLSVQLLNLTCVWANLLSGKLLHFCPGNCCLSPVSGQLLSAWVWVPLAAGLVGNCVTQITTFVENLQQYIAHW